MQVLEMLFNGEEIVPYFSNSEVCAAGGLKGISVQCADLYPKSLMQIKN